MIMKISDNMWEIGYQAIIEKYEENVVKASAF